MAYLALLILMVILILKLPRYLKQTILLQPLANLQSAKSFISKVTEEYNLCQKLAGAYKTNSSCFNYSIKMCLGACINEESAEEYNVRKQKIIDNHTFQDQNMVVIDKGRSIDERSAILIENGIYKGFGFFDLNYQINNIDVLRSIYYTNAA